MSVKVPVWLVIAALPALCGCRAIAGVEDRQLTSNEVDGPGAADATAWAGPVDAYPEACRPCIAERCAAELRSCADDADCDEGHQCLEGRIDPGTTTLCDGTVPESSLLLAQALGACISLECLDDCAPDLPWSCVENYAWPRLSAESATIQMTLLGYFQREPKPEVQVSACDRRDALCEAPFDVGVTDEAGRVTLTVPLLERSATGIGLDGFDGYYWVRGPGVVENLRFTATPVFEPALSFESIVLSPDELALTASLSGSTLDPTRGVVVVGPRDCGLRRAPGIRLTISTADAATAPFYLVNGLPDTQATATTLDGVGGFVNVPPGHAVVTAVIAETGHEIGRTAFFVRANTLTDVNVVPAWTR